MNFHLHTLVKPDECDLESTGREVVSVSGVVIQYVQLLELYYNREYSILPTTWESIFLVYM